VLLEAQGCPPLGRTVFPALGRSSLQKWHEVCLGQLSLLQLGQGQSLRLEAVEWLRRWAAFRGGPRPLFAESLIGGDLSGVPRALLWRVTSVAAGVGPGVGGAAPVVGNPGACSTCSALRMATGTALAPVTLGPVPVARNLRLQRCASPQSVLRVPSCLSSAIRAWRPASARSRSCLRGGVGSFRRGLFCPVPRLWCVGDVGGAPACCVRCVEGPGGPLVEAAELRRAVGGDVRWAIPSLSLRLEGPVARC